MYILGHGYIQLAFNDQKRAKNGQKKAYQNEIVYFEAKYDFQVPKTLNLLIRTVCYLKEWTIYVSLTIVRLFKHPKAKEWTKEELKKLKIAYFEVNYNFNSKKSSLRMKKIAIFDIFSVFL